MGDATCGNFRLNLLLVQAYAKMLQHIPSNYVIYFVRNTLGTCKEACRGGERG